MSVYHQGAKRAWETRRKHGWKRKTRADKKADLLALAHQRLKGGSLRMAEKALTRRYRSHAREDQVIQKYVDRFAEE
jgi:hypothetical protein